MSSKKGFTLAAVVMGCAAFAAGTTVAFAAANSNGDESTRSDSQITHEVQQKLEHDLPSALQNLQVQTSDGVVTLSGRADTGLSELKALQEARKVPGVTHVKDRLRVTM
ncbi:MAG: BON domain-containing protein [Steroidobacteraceae bacterium]